jgi:hypothetical protein
MNPPTPGLEGTVKVAKGKEALAVHKKIMASVQKAALTRCADTASASAVVDEFTQLCREYGACGSAEAPSRSVCLLGV